MGLSYLEDVTNNNTYFTYFSEFERQRTQAYIWEAVIFCLVFIVAFIGNVLVITFIIRFPSMRQVTNYYITNLAVSDLIFSLTAPLVVATRITKEWMLTDGVCHMMVYTMYVCGITSIWTMVLISIDRYRSIVKFDRDKSKFGKIVIRMGLIWIGAMIFSSPIGIFFKELTLKLPDNSEVEVCTLDWRHQPSTIVFCVLNLIFVFCIPLGCIARNYHSIMATFNSSRRRMREYSHSAPQGTLTPPPRRFSRSTSMRSAATAREIRVMSMLILMVSMFAIMWCPIIMIQFFLIMDWLHLQSWHFILTLGITYINVALNPIVYGLLNEQYRKQFRDVFQKIRCRCCTCNICTSKGSADLEMEYTRERTPVVTVCARALEVAGDVALGSNGFTFGHNFENPVYTPENENED